MSSRSSAVVVADDEVLPLTAWFSVHACPEPGVMLRVLELFAKRGLVPQHCLGTASDTALTIEVRIGGLGRDLVDYIARCMRQITGVEIVLTAEISAEG
jgi:hypothetical protein